MACQATICHSYRANNATAGNADATESVAVRETGRYGNECAQRDMNSVDSPGRDSPRMTLKCTNIAMRSRRRDSIERGEVEVEGRRMDSGFVVYDIKKNMKWLAKHRSDRRLKTSIEE